MSKGKIFREAMKRGMVAAPGCYDCVGARAIERAGFDAVYMTGAGTAASLGYPDYGIVTMTEMAENAGRIARAIKMPVIADADTGYGNLNNVVRTVRNYEAAGVQAIHLEDQVTPKKCGAMKGLALISKEEHADKIRIAVATRKSPDFLIIGRSDARIPLGLDEAIARGQAYAAAGADLV
ncbi:MAG: isocitrate lyase/PEP mutase family protein, partial [Bradyrhizobium sp.]